MDFLKNMKAKLEEFEREAQRVMEEQRQQALLQAQGEPGRQPEQPQRGAKRERYPRGGGKQDPNPHSRRSRKPVGSESCPVEEAMPYSERADSPSGDWLLDDLEGRLDEAFLLQEVLGSPRCVRGWED